MDLVFRNSRRVLTTLGLLLLALVPSPSQAQRAITVASTTSTEQSGLFKHILPKFTGSTGIAVRVVALGTGQALDLSRRGDADVVFVHDKEAEEKFVADGFGVTRQEVMYNDFVVVGPKSDPAGAGGKDIQAALRRIAAVKAPFVSRGDRSGTHAAELRLWRDAGLDLAAMKGDWYREIGQGMGPALNTASAARSYVVSDRCRWLAFNNSGGLRMLVEGDQPLFIEYAVMLVDPARDPDIRAGDR